MHGYRTIRLLGVLVLVAALGCRGGDRFPLIPGSPVKVEILYPVMEIHRLVGSDTGYLTVYARFQGATRAECLYDGRVFAAAGVGEPGQGEAWVYRESCPGEPVTSENCLADQSTCGTDLHEYIKLRCILRHFGGPGRHVLTVRAMQGAYVGEASVEMLHDDARLEALALDYIRLNMAGVGPAADPHACIARLSDTTVYVRNDVGPEVQPLLEDMLRNYMEPATGLRFVFTDRLDVRPLIVYLEGGPGAGGCTQRGYPGPDVNPANPYETWCWALKVGRRGPPPADVQAYFSRMDLYMHETGHAVGFPHDATDCVPGSSACGDPRFCCSFMGNCGGLLTVHAYQQRAIRMVYGKPPGYCWR